MTLGPLCIDTTWEGFFDPPWFVRYRLPASENYPSGWVVWVFGIRVSWRFP